MTVVKRRGWYPIIFGQLEILDYELLNLRPIVLRSMFQVARRLPKQPVNG
ncbi:MAG: hypothetical protein ACRC62_14085 [Microcoleus sp.]